MNKLFFKFLGSIAICGALFGCVGPAPILEYNLADQAIKRAQSAGAEKYSSGRWHRANKFYKKGQRYYAERDYSEALEQFVKARETAERAENLSRIKKFNSGDGP